MPAFCLLLDSVPAVQSSMILESGLQGKADVSGLYLLYQHLAERHAIVKRGGLLRHLESQIPVAVRLGIVETFVVAVVRSVNELG